MVRSSLAFPIAVLLSTASLVVACSSKSSDTGSSGSSGSSGTLSTGAAVAGAADTHCAGKPVVTVEQAACHPAPDPDAGDVDGGAMPMADYGETLYNSEGEDDDCKYHVKWQSTTVAKGSDVTFSIVATTRSDSKALAGAKPYAEVFLDDKHPAPNTPVQTTETTPGTYTIGPVRFDVSGKWTVRFHFHDECTDSETSPHGHIAFFVNVP